MLETIITGFFLGMVGGGAACWVMLTLKRRSK